MWAITVQPKCRDLCWEIGNVCQRPEQIHRWTTRPSNRCIWRHHCMQHQHQHQQHECTSSLCWKMYDASQRRQEGWSLGKVWTTFWMFVERVDTFRKVPWQCASWVFSHQQFLAGEVFGTCSVIGAAIQWSLLIQIMENSIELREIDRKMLEISNQWTFGKCWPQGMPSPKYLRNGTDSLSECINWLSG